VGDKGVLSPLGRKKAKKSITNFAGRKGVELGFWKKGKGARRLESEIVENHVTVLKGEVNGREKKKGRQFGVFRLKKKKKTSGKASMKPKKGLINKATKARQEDDKLE